MNYHKTFNCDLSSLTEMMTWVREIVYKYFNQKDLDSLELAVEEIVVNIFEHGYKNKKGYVKISIKINEFVEVEVKDKANKFNPLSIKPKIDKKNLKEKKIGGMGIFLIMQSVDDIYYERKAPYNILTIKKKRKKDY